MTEWNCTHEILITPPYNKLKWHICSRTKSTYLQGDSVERWLLYPYHLIHIDPLLLFICFCFRCYRNILYRYIIFIMRQLNIIYMYKYFYCIFNCVIGDHLKYYYCNPFHFHHDVHYLTRTISIEVCHVIIRWRVDCRFRARNKFEIWKCDESCNCELKIILTCDYSYNKRMTALHLFKLLPWILHRYPLTGLFDAFFFDILLSLLLPGFIRTWKCPHNVLSCTMEILLLLKS